MRRISNLVLVILFLGACDNNPTGPRDSLGPRDRELLRLERAHALWNSPGSPSFDYSYLYERRCYCVGLEPVILEVRGGEVVRATAQATGETVRTEGYPTIEDLFDEVRDAIGSADRFAVSYDACLGYPREFFADPIADRVVNGVGLQVADDEVSFTAALRSPSNDCLDPPLE